MREDGYKVILVNSNPATIQNDPEMADKVYIEPLLPDTIRRILEIERPDALLAGMGGQTALNIASELAHAGVLGSGFPKSSVAPSFTMTGWLIDTRSTKSSNSGEVSCSKCCFS